MTDMSEADQINDLETEVCERIDPEGYGWASGDSPSIREVIEAVLASDWLSAYVAAALPVLAADRDVRDLVDEGIRQKRRANEAREQLAARDQVIERLKTQRAEDERWVQGVLDAVREVANNMHDPLRGLSMSGGEVQDTLREILDRAALADPGQWEADSCTKVCQYAVDVGMEMYSGVTNGKCTEHKGYMRHCAEMDARADRVAEATSSELQDSPKFDVRIPEARVATDPRADRVADGGESR